MVALSIIISLLALASAVPMLNVNESVIPDNGTLSESRVIKLTSVGCWEEQLKLEDVLLAKEKLVQWGLKHAIPTADMHGEESGRVGVWVCNCKHFKTDHISKAELDEALVYVQNRCGAHTSGWVWSKSWQKSWAFNTPYRMKVLGNLKDRCPHYCTWDYW